MKKTYQYQNVDSWNLQEIIQQYCYERQIDELNPGRDISSDWLVTIIEKHLKKIEKSFLPENEKTKKLVGELFFYEHHYNLYRVLVNLVDQCYDKDKKYKSLVKIEKNVNC